MSWASERGRGCIPPDRGVGSESGLKERPLVSIITPSLNQGRFVEETILSVERQDYPKLEHLVIDGGSGDGTVEVLRRHAQLVWVSEPDGGQADALNKGFRRAKGEILGWLNSDDVYVAGTISHVVDHFSTHPQVDVVYGDCLELDEGGRVCRTIKARPADLERMLLFDFSLYQPTFFFRRRAIDKIGALDAGLHLALDYDYIVRAVRACTLAYLPRPLAAFRGHSRSKTVLRGRELLPEYLRVLDAVFSDPTLPRALAKLQRRARSIAYSSCAEHSLKAGELKEARARFLTSLRLYPQPFRGKSVKAMLCLFDLLLGVGLGRWLLGLAERFRSPLPGARCF